MPEEQTTQGWRIEYRTSGSPTDWWGGNVLVSPANRVYRSLDELPGYLNALEQERDRMTLRAVTIKQPMSADQFVNMLMASAHQRDVLLHEAAKRAEAAEQRATEADTALHAMSIDLGDAQSVANSRRQQRDAAVELVGELAADLKEWRESCYAAVEDASSTVAAKNMMKMRSWRDTDALLAAAAQLQSPTTKE